MKRLLTIILSSFFVLGFLAGCTDEEEDGDVSGEPTPVPVCENHLWIEANYQEPQICRICGETEGVPKPPGFEASGYYTNAQADIPYPYVTVAEDFNGNTGIPIIGEVVFRDFRVFQSDSRGYPEKEGYEYRQITVDIKFTGLNEQICDIYTAYSFEDYYTFDPSRPVANDNDAKESEISGFFVNDSAANIFGINYETYLEAIILWDDWGEDSLTGTWVLTALVPIGYDGVVLSLYNHANFPKFHIDEEDESTAAELFDRDTLHIRLK